MAEVAERVIVGTAISNKRIFGGPGRADYNETTLNISENLKGMAKNSIVVTWTETSKSHPLVISQTYLLFLRKYYGKIRTIPDISAATKVSTGGAKFSDTIVGIEIVKKLVSGK